MFTPARTAALVVVGVALAVYAFAQPSLTPPAGPVSESDRFGTRIALNQANTPGDSEALFVITEPGSYYLPANADAGDRDGIQVDADDVTIDLNGFTLKGSRKTGSTTPVSARSRPCKKNAPSQASPSATARSAASTPDTATPISSSTAPISSSSIYAAHSSGTSV